jgi:5-methylcytosine-specific restriction endonuclease McrA
MEQPATGRRCLRKPIPEIADAARLLDAAVTAHLMARRDLAEELIRLADMPALRDYGESLWGTKSPHVQYRPVPDAPPSLAKDQRVKVRMPNTAEKAVLYRRDGYHCRFCGIPVIRKEMRKRIREVYPDALRWGPTNAEQHAAFQLMWAQYDHVLPHARGGNNELDNVVIACAGCNFARMHYTLEEVGVVNPRTCEPTRPSWDGLERFH